MDVVTELEQAPADAARSAFVAFARSGDAALVRSGGPEHLTASCFVLTPPDLTQVLLTHHRKGRFRVQLGGHLEPGVTSLADAARREGREESGAGDLQLLTERVLDLERHELHGGFSCAAHGDVGFVAVASPAAVVQVSPESLDVRWFAVDALPSAVPPGFPERLVTVRARAAALPVVHEKAPAAARGWLVLDAHEPRATLKR